MGVVQGSGVISQTVSSRRWSSLPLMATMSGLELVTIMSKGTVAGGASEALRPGRPR